MGRRTSLRIQRRGLEIDDAVLTATEKDAARIEWALDRKWLSVFWWVIVLSISCLAGRVFFLNVVKGAYYQEMARRNSIRSIVVPAPRGIIYDRFGKALVHNVPSVDLAVIPADLPRDESERRSLLEDLGSIVRFEPGEIDEAVSRLNGRSLLPVPVKERLTQEEVLVFLGRSREFPGFSLVKSATRNYMDSVVFSHLLGYEGRIRKEEAEQNPDYLLTDSIGKQGLEKSYEKHLRGIHGADQVEVDSLGKVKKELGVIPPKAGSDLILNIDADLQKKIYDSLRSQLEKSGLKQGAAVAVDPRDGAVLALVSIPSFDNNLFAQGIENGQYQALIQDPSRPLFNRVISGEYPPGSTIKPMLAAAALTEGVITEHTEVESKGGIQVGNFFFGDWRVNGITDVRRAIAVSSDVFFYAIGGGYGGVRGMGMEVMKRYEELFGWGGPTGIDLPGEADGFLPDPAWKREKKGERWYIGDDYHASIGQGFVLATPLQIINSIAAIANGGTLYQPRIVSQVRRSDGTAAANSPKVIRENFIDPDILRIAREGMRQTVTEGTAQPLRDLSVEIAGKTGTAQFGNEDKTHGWFVSFAPYDRPEIAMLVLAEGQGDQTYNAVPVTKEVYEWYFNRDKAQE
jgi:penicillin-binding protein 2